jgi:hypothetical protein
MRFPTLRELVMFGIPATNRQPSPADKKAAAEARRQVIYDRRARKCAAELSRVAGLMTPSEFARYGKRLDMAARTALKQKSSLKDLRLDLSDLLPPDLAARCGLPPDLPTTVAPKNWERRGYPANLVADTQPAADGKMVITAEDIINAAKRARGDIPPEKKLDPGKAIKPSERWMRR